MNPFNSLKIKQSRASEGMIKHSFFQSKTLIPVAKRFMINRQHISDHALVVTHPYDTGRP